MLDGATAQGVVGMVADIAGYSLRPWGFDPPRSRGVLLGYGAGGRAGAARARRVVPRAVADARLEVVPGVGHLVVVPFWAPALTGT